MIRFDDVHAVKLISQATEVQFVPTLHHCIAEYDTEDRLNGGVLFTDYSGGSVQVHVAGFRKNWATKALLFLTFHYPFEHLKVKKLIGLVPEHNWPARNLNLHLGFKIEYLVGDVFNHRNSPNGMYIMSMRREECRWLHMKQPKFVFAPPERTNPIDSPLAAIDETRMTVQ